MDLRNKNCLVQCKMDRVQNNCGCVPYYYPSEGKDVICPMEKFPCSFKNRQVGKMYTLIFEIYKFYFLFRLICVLKTQKIYLDTTIILKERF